MSDCSRVSREYKGRAPAKALFFALTFISYTLLLTSPTPASANPEGGQVTAGQAVISTPNANTVQIHQGSDKAVIDWRTFNIKQSEKTQFIQPTTKSITLNRVDPTHGASSINGALSANGQIWLINPAGVVFGTTARVDAAGLLVTTANITNDDFMAGNYHFVQSPNWNGAVINNGKITIKDGGMAALVAPGVENNGVIQANLGQVVLGAGTEYTVDFYGDHLIQFSVNSATSSYATRPDGTPLSAAISNKGKIIANGGKVLMTAKTAGAVLDNTINMSGYVQAKTAVQRGGSIILMGGSGTVKVSGKMIASGKHYRQKGGSIKVLGRTVAIVGKAKLDTSGHAGGGEILIGGNAQGKGPESNAHYAFIGSNALLNASALKSGDGGKVVVWSDKGTQFYGNIFAKGGSESGNGGWVETSGKEYLAAFGNVNASAAHGMAGSWLLDPANITISSAVTSNGSFNGLNPNQYTTTANTAVANVGTINASLNAGTSVTILTTPGGTQAGTITLAAGAGNQISKTAGGNATLTLNATDSITLSNTISSTTGALNITLISGNAITINNAITTNGGNFLSTSQNATTLANSINTGTGTVTLNVNANGAGADAFAMNTGSSIATTNTGASAVAITVNTGGGGTGTATLRNIATGSGGTITVTSNNAGTIFAPSTLSGNLNVTSGGSITQTGAITMTGTPTFTLATAATDISLAGFANNFSTTPVITNNGNVRDVLLRNDNASATVPTIPTGLRDLTLNFANASSMVLPAITLTRTLSATANGPITQTGALVIPTNATFAAGAANNITLNNAGNNFGTILITNGNNVNILDSNALIFGNTTVSGALTASTTTGTMTDTGILSVTGLTTLTAAGAINNITLNSAGNNFSTLKITGANNAAIVDTNSLNMDTSTLTGTLNLTTGGAITQSGILNITGTTTLSAPTPSDITLNLNNNFSTIAIINGKNISITDTNGLTLGTSIVSGNYDIITNGALIQSGTQIVGGLTSINSNSNNVTLATAANNFNTIKVLNGANVSLRDTNSMILDDIAASGTLTLQIGAANTMTQALGKTIQAAGTTTLIGTATGNITLTNTGNDFATVSTTIGNNVNLHDTNSIILGTSTISGAFDVTAGGTISQSGVLTVTGTPTFTVTSPLSDISLATSANNFNTTPVFTNNGNIRDLLLRNANNGAVVPVLPTGLRNLTLNFSGTNVAMALSGISLTGNLSATTTGVMTQTGSLSGVNLTALTLNNAGTAITLSNSGNDFSNINLQARNAANSANVAGAITYRDATGFDVTSIATTSTVNLTAGNAMTQTGSIVGTTLTAKTLNNTGAGITFNNAANALTTVNLQARNAADNANAAGAIVYRDTNAINLANISTTSDATVTAGNVITQSGVLTGTSLIVKTLNNTAASTNITLNSFANNFNSIDLRARNAGDTANIGGVIQYQGASGFNVARIGTTSTINLVANGAITDSGNIAGTTLTTNSIGGTVLDFGSNLTGFNATNITSGNISLTNTGALSITGISQSGSGDFILNNTGTTTVTGTVNTNTGDTFITSTGAVTDSVAGAILSSMLSVKTLANAGAAITLNNVALHNVIVLDLRARNLADTANAAGAINYRDSSGFDVVAANTTSTVTLTGAGAITDSGSIQGTTLTTNSVGGTVLDFGSNITTFNATNSGSGDINLLNTGALTISGIVQTGGGNIDVNNTGNITIPIGTTFTSDGGNITLQTAGNTINLNSNILSNNGAINFLSAVALGNTVTVNAGNGAILFNDVLNGASQTLTVQNNISANGSVTFNGNTALNNLITFSQPYEIIFNGSNNTLTNATTFNNTGGVSLINNGVFNFTNGLTYTAGVTTLYSTINTTSAPVNLNAIVLAGNSNITTNDGNMTFGTITGGTNDLGLDSGTFGDILFTNNTSLANLTVLNTHDLTNNGTMNLAFYLQNAGNIASLGTNTLNTSGAATITSNSVLGNMNIGGLLTINAETANGTVNVGGFTLNVSGAVNMFGSVGGSTGQAAIQKMTYANPPPGLQFFDGIDLHDAQNPPAPIPTPTPTPIPPGVINAILQIYPTTTSSTTAMSSINLLTMPVVSSETSASKGRGGIIENAATTTTTTGRSSLTASARATEYGNGMNSAEKTQMMHGFLSDMKHSPLFFNTQAETVLAIDLMKKVLIAWFALLLVLSYFGRRVLFLSQFLTMNYTKTLSFNLRTSLNNIIASADIIQSQKLTDLTAEQKEFLNDIITSSNEMKYLMADFDSSKRITMQQFNKMIFDLRTQLANIMGFAGLMQNAKWSPVNSEVNEYLGYIMSNSQSILKNCKE